MKPIAKKGLVLIGILYTATVAAMVTNFVMEAKPKEPEQVAEQIQMSLNRVRAWAHERDPEHIRPVDITRQEAALLLHDLLARKGTIININFTLLLQGLNFAILLLILYGWLWDPLLAFLDKRRSIIKERLAEAAKNKQEAAQLLRQRHQELGQLRKERGAIIEHAKGAAEQEREQIVDRAHQEAERLMGQTQERLGEELRRARLSLRKEVAEIATLIASKVLRREVSRKDHDTLIEQMVEQMTTDKMEGPGTGSD